MKKTTKGNQFSQAHSWTARLLCLAMIICSCQPTNKTKDANPKDATSTRDSAQWISLFNGKNLEGWEPKIKGYALGDNYGNTFRVVDGLLSVLYDSVAYPAFDNRFGHLFYESPFEDYRLKVVYRFVGAQCVGGESWAYKNSGVMLHCQAPKTMQIDQDFPISLEAQLLGAKKGDDRPRPTMNLCTPGTHVYIADTLHTAHCTPADGPSFYGEEWITAEVEVYHDSLFRHYVNGEKVLEYSRASIGGGVVSNYDPAIKKDGQPLTSGYIAIQSESHPIQFKTIDILKL